MVQHVRSGSEGLVSGLGLLRSPRGDRHPRHTSALSLFEKCLHTDLPLRFSPCPFGPREPSGLLACAGQSSNGVPKYQIQDGAHKLINKPDRTAGPHVAVIIVEQFFEHVPPHYCDHQSCSTQEFISLRQTPKTLHTSQNALSRKR